MRTVKAAGSGTVLPELLVLFHFITSTGKMDSGVVLPQGAGYGVGKNIPFFLVAF